MLSVRRAKVKDIDQLLHLARALNDHHLEFDAQYFALSDVADQNWRTYFRRMIYSPTSLVLVASHANQIVAYTVAGVKKRAPIFREPAIATIDDLFVQPDYRQQGVARQLVEHVIAWLKQLHPQIRYLDLQVYQANQTAVQAWQKLGFSVLSLRQRRILQP